MQNVHEKVRRELYENRDEAYDTFNAALIPGVSDTIGVRVPVLRALTKRLAKDGWEDYFKEADGTHEEKMIRAFLFAYVKNDDASGSFGTRFRADDRRLGGLRRVLSVLSNGAAADGIDEGMDQASCKKRTGI